MRTKSVSQAAVGIVAIIVFGFLIRAPAQVCDPPPSGIVSWWPFDANANDIVGGNNGSINGGVTIVSGEVSNAFSFDGLTGYVSVPDVPNLDFGTTGAFSIEGWFNWTGARNGNGVNNIVRKSNYSAPGSGYWIRIGGDGLEFFVGDGYGGGISGLVATPVTANVWHHFAGTRDSDGTMNLYLDGQLEGTVSAPNANATCPSIPFAIGAWVGNLGNREFFSGDIDEISVYNSVLTSSEVQAIYQAGSAGKCRTPQVPVVTWANPTSIIYGNPLTSIQLNASANVAGSFVYDPDVGTVLDAGTNMLSVVFTPNDTNDYSSATDMVSLAVTPAPLTITVGNTNRPYGGTNPPFSGVIGVLVNGDDISLVYSCSATNSSPVGEYPIVPALVDPDDRQTNYTISIFNGTLTITPDPLTVSAANASRLVGATNPIFTGVITGLTNGDNITATYSTSATTSSPAGSYPIVPTLVDPDDLATNYSVTLVNGTLTVIGPPIIQTVQQSGDSVIFTFSATTNQMYQIQATATLAPANWTNIGGTLIATNSTMTISELIGTNSQQFYRVALVP